MIALEIIGWILLSLLGFVLLLLVLLCSLKLSLQAGYCETLLLKVGIGPVKLNLSDSMQMSKEEAEEFTAKKKKKAAKPKEKPKKKKEKPPKYTEKPPLTAVVTAFKDLAVGILTRFAKHIKLEELRLRVLAASDDAAKTALEYGSFCAAAGMVQEGVYLIVDISGSVGREFSFSDHGRVQILQILFDYDLVIFFVQPLDLCSSFFVSHMLFCVVVLQDSTSFW